MGNKCFTDCRYAGLGFGSVVWVAAESRSKALLCTVIGVELKDTSLGIVAKSYTMLPADPDECYLNPNTEERIPLYNVQPENIFEEQIPAIERVIQILDSQIRDVNTDVEDMIEHRVKNRMKLQEILSKKMDEEARKEQQEEADYDKGRVPQQSAE